MIEIETQWSMADVQAAHAVIDAIEAAHAKAMRDARRKRR